MQGRESVSERRARQFPRPGDLHAGETFDVPDDAFFSPDGTRIVATQEDDFAIGVNDVAKRRIVYRYGTPGSPGSGPNQLWNPDDAMLLPGDWILTADIKNCRVLLIKLGAHRPQRIYGDTTQGCVHAPPARWGSPNGVFPMRNGHFLVTEINDRVIVSDPRTNRIVWQYGHTGRPGSAPGYLDDPDGVDLAPPHSLLIRQRATIGRPRG